MWKFYHQQRKVLLDLIAVLNASKKVYASNGVGYDALLIGAIQQLKEWADKYNKADAFASIALVELQYINGLRGLDSLSIAKEKTTKIEIKKLYFVRSHHALDELLQTLLVKIDEALATARKDLTSLILAAIQGGSLSVDFMKSANESQIDQFWKSLNGSNDVTAIKSRVALTVGRHDIVFIIQQLFTEIQEGML